jgi:CBS domain-containing protein
MRQYDLHELLVVEDGQMIGIVTQGDVRAALPADKTTRMLWDVNHTWDRVTAHLVMTPTVITIRPQDNLRRAARLMLEHKISRLPVVNQHGRVVGLLSSHDIYRMLDTLRENDSAPEVAAAGI